MGRISPELLERYLSGAVSGHERALVQSWLAARPENNALVQVLSTMDVSGRPELVASAANRESDWQVLLGQMNSGASIFDRIRRIPVWQPVAVAAALLIGFIGLKTGLLAKLDIGGEAVEASYATKVRQTMRVQLAPGITAAMAAGTKSKFHGLRDRNEVELDGEAMFTIDRTASAIPFIVRSSDAEVRVLGTRFAVRAFEGERDVRVVVAEGKVSVLRGTASEVIVQGDVIRMSKDGAKELLHNRIPDRYMRYAEGRLAFANSPLDEVVADMSRWFGVDVRLASPELVNEHFTANFGPEDIDFVLMALEHTMPVRIQRTNGVVLIWSQNTKPAAR